MAGYQNPGWPGCCRPPGPGEQAYIGAADWRSVSVVHHVPIPPEIKAILDSLTPRSAGSAMRTALPSSQPPTMSRRSSAPVVQALRGDSTPTKTLPMSIPGKAARGGGSPQQLTASLTGSASRTSGGDGTPSSLQSTTSSMDQVVLPRRPTIETQTDRRRDHSREAKQSPGRKYTELTGTLSRKGSSHRPSLSTSSTSVFVNKITVDAQPQPRRTQPSNASPPPPNSVTASRTAEREAEKERANAAVLRRRRSSLEEGVAGLSISSGSSASSSDSGDGSETTVISDGGFTDYLSDESEAELQRQAEIRAAVLEQSHMEEQEFRAARQQLANIDLRPPKSWTSNVNTTPRSQNAPQPSGLGATLISQPFGSTSYAGSAASQSRV